MLEERIGLAQTSGNLEWGPHEKQVDLVAAIGMASKTPHTKLGALMLRLFVANDPRAYREAVDLLAHRIKVKNYKISRTMAKKLADRALHETAFYICRHCIGTGRVTVDHKITICKHCSGTGRHVFTAAERARALGISRRDFDTTWEDRLVLAKNIAGAAYNSVVRWASKRR